MPPINLNYIYIRKLKNIFIFQGKYSYIMLKSCPQMFETEMAQVLSTAVMNHFESMKILLGRKHCLSSHRMSLITATTKHHH